MALHIRTYRPQKICLNENRRRERSRKPAREQVLPVMISRAPQLSGLQVTSNPLREMMEQCPRGGNVCLSTQAVFSKVAHLLPMSVSTGDGLYSSRSGVMLLYSAIASQSPNKTELPLLGLLYIGYLSAGSNFLFPWRGTVPAETVLELRVSIKKISLCLNKSQRFHQFPG